MLLFQALGRGVMRKENKRKDEKMRKYGENGRLEAVLCNRCGKKLVVKDGILREGAASFQYNWDYFSEKDGEIHRFDLCEECYDRITAEFCISIQVEEQLELL